LYALRKRQTIVALDQVVLGGQQGFNNEQRSARIEEQSSTVFEEAPYE
jgi:hypothetical protein